MIREFDNRFFMGVIKEVAEKNNIAGHMSCYVSGADFLENDEWYLSVFYNLPDIHIEYVKKKEGLELEQVVYPIANRIAERYSWVNIYLVSQ